MQPRLVTVTIKLRVPETNLGDFLGLLRGFGDVTTTLPEPRAPRPDDDIVRAFLEETCVFGPAFRAEPRHLIDAFLDWQQYAGRTPFVGPRGFSNALKRLGFVRKQVHGVRFWYGVGRKDG